MRQNKAYPTSYKKTKKGFKIHFLVFLLVTPIIWLVWYLTSTKYIWPLWSTAGWGLGLLFHYFGVYIFKKK